MVEAVTEQLDLDAVARKAAHERSALLRVLPSRRITPDDLTQDDECDKPHKSFEVETNGRTRRIRVLFDRIATPLFRMSTEHYCECGPRDLIVDAARDIAGELDSKFAHAADLLVVEPGKPVPETGKVQWLRADDTMNRNSLAQALKDVRQLFEPKFAVIGRSLAKDMLRFSREEASAALPLEFEAEGIIWYIVDRDRSVPSEAVYFLGPSEQVGRTYTLQDVTICFSQPGEEFGYFIDMVMGSVIFDVSLVARVDFKIE